MPTLELIAEKLQRLYVQTNNWIPGVVRSYVMLCMEFLRLQRELEKTGKYLLHSEREAQERVYHNENVYGDYYLPGLLLSEALWPNHFSLNELFSCQFLPMLKESCNVLEVGVGTGYHLYQFFDSFPASRYCGVDISDFASQFAQRFAFDGKPTPDNVSILLRDATKGINVEDSAFDGGILGEVLEHVERPAELLTELSRVLVPGSKLFMTTVIFAANIDHIYLFEKADDVRQLIAKTPWSIHTEMVLPVYITDSPDMVQRPMNYGCILINRKVE